MKPNSGPPSLTEADELALDAFLSELHRPSKRPPDLSSQILQALAETPLHPVANAPLAGVFEALNGHRAAEAEIAVRVVPRSSKESGEHAPVVRRVSWRSSAAALAFAASLVGIATFTSRFWQSGQNIAQHKPDPAIASDVITPSEQKTKSESKSNTSDSKPGPGARVAPRTAIVLNPPAAEQTPPSDKRIVMTSEAASGSVAGVAQISAGAVATEMNRQLNEYWKRIGIVPTQTATDSEIAARIETRIGYRPDVLNGSIDQDLFTSKDQAESIAEKLVTNLTFRLPLSGEIKQQMIDEAAEKLASGAAFDVLVANWVQQGHFASGNQPHTAGEVVAERLLNVDLSCARCHDSPVDSSLTQTDYWAFAACFKPASQTNLFYELPDGRQRAADAAIPIRWTGLQEPATSTSGSLKPNLTGIASLLKNNSRLAESLANQIWETVYGAPLVSRSSDPLAPPRDDSLQQMHQRLASAIVQSGFDLRTAYRIVLNSDSMKRTVPDLYAENRWVTASEEQLADEGARVRAFAAQAPPLARMPRQQLLSAMSTKLGHDPTSLPGFETILAQPLLSPDSQGSRGDTATNRVEVSEQEKIWTQWLADRKVVEESWLHWIKDPAQQRKHAFYAASLQPNPDAEEIAKQLQSDDDENDSLSANDRLMWVLIRGK